MVPILGVQATVAGATGPTITRTPGLGAAGTAVHMSGTGFGANETVILRFDATQVGTAPTNGSGSVPSTTFKGPTTATLGTHTVSATGATSGLFASLHYFVAARVSIFDSSNCTSGFFCYKPPSKSLPAGNWVQWRNNSSSSHTVTRCTVEACGVG